MQTWKLLLKRMALFLGLLTISSLFTTEVFATHSFPFRNLSSLLLQTYAVCLLMYYRNRIAQNDYARNLIQAIAWMVLLAIVLRSIKYSAFKEVGILARHTWYFYYVPVLLMPMLLLRTALIIHAENERRVKRSWGWMVLVTAALIVLVLTNDSHQLVFTFRPNFENWDSDYGYRLAFFAVIAWEQLLYLAAVIVLTVKCRLSSAKKQAYLILIPYALATTVRILLMTGQIPKINGNNIIEFPETVGMLVACVLECCIQLGLIPTNEDYRGLMKLSSVPAQITDDRGTTVFQSDIAETITPTLFASEDNTKIDDRTILRKKPIPGGFTFWLEDISELNRLNESLEEIKEQLSEERELIRLQNELKETQAQLAQRERLYDSIAKRTAVQSRAISRLARMARETDEEALRETCRRQIVFLASYIKRCANLLLLADSNAEIPLSELGLSIAESLHYLNYCGIPGELLNTASGSVCAQTALTIYEAFEHIMEAVITRLKVIYVTLSEDADTVLLKLTLEGVPDYGQEALPPALCTQSREVRWENEDGIVYLCAVLPKGGMA